MHPTWPNLRAQARPSACSHGRVVGYCGHVVAVALGPVAGRDGRVAGTVPRDWLVVSRHSAQPHSLSLLPPVTIHYMYCDTIPCLASFSLSQYTQCIVTQYLKPTSGHNTLLCIAIQSFPSQTLLSQYNSLYCNTNTQAAPQHCHNTIIIL